MIIGTIIFILILSSFLLIILRSHLEDERQFRKSIYDDDENE